MLCNKPLDHCRQQFRRVLANFITGLGTDQQYGANLRGSYRESRMDLLKRDLKSPDRTDDTSVCFELLTAANQDFGIRRQNRVRKGDRCLSKVGLLFLASITD